MNNLSVHELHAISSFNYSYNRAFRYEARRLSIFCLRTEVNRIWD